MSYRVLLFGAEAAAAGVRKVDVPVDEDVITADELKDHLANAYPELSGVPSCRIAVNQRFVDGNDKVAPGDEIALIGPVSGG